MPSKKIIVCFTNSYPYGARETYFETELQYLSKGFDKVVIIPKYNPYDKHVDRSIPENVEIWEPLVPRDKVVRFFVGLFNRSPFGFYLKDFFKERVYLSFNRLLNWGRSLLMYRRMYQRTKSYFKTLGDNTVMYSYWAEAPLLATRLTLRFTRVVRMHRGDFYVSEHQGYLPVRQKIYEEADILLPISEEISGILKNDYSIKQDKIFINYLGVLPSVTAEELLDEDPKGYLRIVSCSRVDPIKRVDLIAEAIMMIGEERSVEWHHFGDGTEFERLKKMVKDCPKNVSVILHGWAELEEINRFYKQNYVSWFVNVSKHEGVPVSIMEAMSFGIPTIATDVGATRELVNEHNGYLVGNEVNPEELASLLIQDQNPRYASKRIEAYNTWNNRFNADRNFTRLTGLLNSFRGG